MFIYLYFIVFAYTLYSCIAQFDPAEYFRGSQQRPQLEIINPENGQVLEEGILEIEIKVNGYHLPSNFHDSSICVAFTSEKDFIGETCFDQSQELKFHASGFVPGMSYSLRILFLERGKVIAMGLRSFRVAGILGVIKDTPVTIQTALQIALNHQTSGLITEAEKIYLRILEENPNHADALNLLSLAYRSHGDHSSALQYLERAVKSSNTSFEILNNLGETLNIMGRIQEAKKHFEMAISLNSNYFKAIYNLGVLLQKHHISYNRAILLYRKLLDIESNHPNTMTSSMHMEVKVRECDLLKAMTKGHEYTVLNEFIGYPSVLNEDIYNYINMNVNKEQGDDEVTYLDYSIFGKLQSPVTSDHEIQCWLQATELFKTSDLVQNELGNAYVQVGNHQKALEAYVQAASQGILISIVNQANVLEMLGYYHEAESTFKQALQKAETLGWPSFHVKIRLAMVIPRILPSTEYELLQIRKAMGQNLDKLLIAASTIVPEASPPLYHGFSTGYFLAYHGGNNLKIKNKLYQIYLLYCPALQYGYFANPVTGDLSGSETKAAIEGKPPAWIDAMQTNAIVEAAYKGLSLPNSIPSDIMEVTSDVEDFISANSVHDNDNEPTVQLVKADEDKSIIPDYSNGVTNDSEYTSRVLQLRIGFASRFFYQHPIGYMSENVLSLLSKFGYKIILFIIDGVTHRDRIRSDVVQRNIISQVSEYHLLPAEITSCIKSLRNSKLDVLVYPEISLDPIIYFAAYSKIAPIQVTWLGHVDTSGMSSIDYYISDTVELPNAESTYSEALFKMDGMGTCFVDHYYNYAVALTQPRTVLLDRAKFIEMINIPRAAHLYLIPQPLYSLHPVFDEVITSILLQDKLAYVVLLDDTGNEKTSWKSILNTRLGGKFSVETSSRIKYLSNFTDISVLKILSVAHVVLDPFPGSDYVYNMHALSLGVPVITMPSQRMIGRQTLSLYTKLDYHQLIVGSVSDYINLALTLAHKPKVRQIHVDNLMLRRNKLFNCTNVLSQWNNFFNMIVNVSDSVTNVV